MLQRVDAKEPAKTRESRVLEFWNEHHVFKKSEEIREGQPEFVFYEGPPTANGKPHPGHVLTRLMKDVYPRFKTMKGFHVERKAGWDTHGLPVEIEIEKKHGISGKKQIQAFGIERFIQECKDSVWTYEKTWRELTERLAYWTDLDNPYMTLTDDYIESVWNILHTVYDKGLLYQGHRVSPYCPHCETTLSSHEVAQGYADVKDLTVTAKFRVTETTASGAGTDGTDTPTFILAWTTTPWTLPSNVALAVNPNLTYVLIHSAEHGENYWVAEGLKDGFLHEGDSVIDQKTGTELLGVKYEPVFPYVKVEGKKFEVVTSNHVTEESGTGIVHMAPAFGEDDYRVCQEHGMVYCNFVDLTGRFTDDVTDFAGRFVRDEDVNVDIVKDLAARGVMYEKHKYEHSYPHCWRCDTPLLYYAIDSWFIRMTEVKDQVIKNSQGVNWMPEHIKDGRMGNFLDNLVDWNLSRSRYWGTPLPIWVCDKCGEKECIGSRAELKEKAGRLPSELHKPYIDDITYACSCGGTMRRVPEVIDVWFDSGSMPFAQWHYPFEHQDDFHRLFPADYICEAIDQTRGWFYSLLAISTLMTGQAPYKNVLVLGHVVDESGKKMSKSKGNVIDPFEAFDMHGADALRFYFLVNNQPWNSQRFYHRAVAESKAKFIDLLQNVHAFYALYASIDGFNPADHNVPVAERPLMDKWILARMNDVVDKIDRWLNKYDATSAARALQGLVDDLSTWYIRRNRERFWAPGMEADKIAAYRTLYEVLETVAKLAAPMTPFIAEELYQNVVRTAYPDAPLSVHLTDFPVADMALVDKSLLDEMSEVLDVVEAGRHLRNETKMKTRQPLSKLYVSADKAALLQKFTEVIKDELNVKELVYAELDAVAKPELFLNLKAVGQDYGKLVPVLNKAAKSAGPEVIAAFREKGEVELEGQRIGREHGELRFHPVFEGMLVTTPHGFVGLDTTLTPELIEEGFVRELVSKMQMMRKEVNYNVTDRVTFAASGDAEVLKVLRDNAEEIAATVLAYGFVFEGEQASVGAAGAAGQDGQTGSAGSAGFGDGDLTKDWDVNGKPLRLTVKK
ncbi:isoleucine--tRNA ligase [Alicyclobacillus ferrooxydans]|uniref:Isoleucine--tRNA ligase n=1 Tax=Alicyclobacillus ferrooxydans TaxID=471514 RepID=A0A0P9C4Y7_9BACL|nr:isoleucine--tRNA ligase [Alicyclobacillus ferrooxydans]KPV39891.1 isoleucyl-tRNA synthetase [Alicyclobacillus ferrooxydans]